MEQLAILEKICNNLFDSLERGTATYIFYDSVNAAIYDTWWPSNDIKLKENLMKK